MRRRLRAAGWVLLGLAVLSVSVIVPVGALRANTDAQFGRWVGWATVAALPIAAVGVVLLLWDKFIRSMARPDMSAAVAEQELAAVVLAQSQVARSLLIGTDEVDDHAANVRFVKGAGRFREVGGASEGELASVLEYYQSLSPGRLLVLGDPGAGKTVLSLELLIRLMEQRQEDECIPVPVLISAAAYDIGSPWDEWLVRHLSQRFSMGAQVASRLVGAGRVLPVVDGLDEMDPHGPPVRARALVMALNSSMRGRERAPVVVTSRREEYQALGKTLDRATCIEMIPLTGSEAAAYLDEQFLGAEERHRWERVVAELRTNEHGLVASQLATPWRLTLALTVFRDAGDPDELLPGPILDPYTQRVDALLLERYTPAKVRLYSRDSGYTLQQVQQWLTVLATGLDWQARHNGSATDVQLDQWWRPAGRWVNTLVHMAAVAIIALPLFVSNFGAPPTAARITALGVLFLGVVLAATAPSPHRLNARQLITQRGLLRFLLALASISVPLLVSGLVPWRVFGTTFVSIFQPSGGLRTALAIGLALGIAGGIIWGAMDNSPQALGPREVIQADGRYGLTVGLPAGAVCLLVGGSLGGFRYGVAFALAGVLAFTLVFILGFGSSTWVRYHVSVAIGAIRRTGPIGFGAFLDWSQQAGLLRLSGISYQFRHRQLQDWLATHKELTNEARRGRAIDGSRSPALHSDGAGS